MKKDNKGFSLVELIIVIAIMAVLVGLLAPQYLKYVENSKVSTDISNAQEVATAINVAFADDNPSYKSGSPVTKLPDGKALPTLKASGAAAGGMSVTIDDNGVKEIKNGSYILWPDPKDSTNGYYTKLHKK